MLVCAFSKNIFKVLFALFVLFSLYGCGDDEANPEAGAAGKGSGTQGNTQAAQEALDEKTLELLKKYGLHQAASLGDVAAVQAFIDAGAPLEETDGFKGQVPLHWAAKQGYPLVCEALLKAGVNPDKKSEVLEITALHFAAINGGRDKARYVEVIKVLLKWKANPNIQGQDGYTPLHEASEKGHAEIVTVLLAAPNIDITITNEDGKTAKEVAKDDTIKALFPE